MTSRTGGNISFGEGICGVRNKHTCLANVTITKDVNYESYEVVYPTVTHLIPCILKFLV